MITNEREEIINLFRKRGLRSGEFYPLRDFLTDIDFDGDPTRSDAKRQAFSRLLEEGFFVEMDAALQLTDNGYALTRSDSNERLATAIDRLAERLVIAKGSELAHMRELTGALAGIEGYLERISYQFAQLLADRET